MIERMQIRLQKYFKEHTAYLIVYWSYVAITIIPILLVGYLFNVLPFVIISSILGNELIRYTYGFHQTDNKMFLFYKLYVNYIWIYFNNHSNRMVIFDWFILYEGCLS